MNRKIELAARLAKARCENTSLGSWLAPNPCSQTKCPLMPLVSVPGPARICLDVGYWPVTDMPLPRETGRKHREQASQFYEFGLDEIVPKGHLFRTQVGLRAGGTAFGALKASVLFLGRRASRWRLRQH